MNEEQNVNETKEKPVQEESQQLQTQTPTEGFARNNWKDRKPYRRTEEGSEEGQGGFYKKSRFGSFKKKKCRFCGKTNQEVEKTLNYKHIELLEKFVSDRGKILPARATGNCAIHQRKIKVEVKKARYVALLPFSRIEKLNK